MGSFLRNIMGYSVVGLLVVCVGVSASAISIRQDTSSCPQTCYGGPLVDSSDTTYYRSLCTDHSQLGRIVTCFRDTCPGTDAEIADLKDRCAKAGVTLTVTYTPNSIQISSSFGGPPPAPVPSTPPPVTSTSTTDTSAANAPTSSSSSSQPLTSSDSSPSSPSPPSSPIPSPTPTPNSDTGSNSPKDKPPLGPIIGGTVGGGAGLILLTILIFVLLRSHRKSGNGDRMHGDMVPKPKPPPDIRPATSPKQSFSTTEARDSRTPQLSVPVEASPNPEGPTENQRPPVYEPTT